MAEAEQPKKKPRKFTTVNQPSVFEFFELFPNEESAREYIINCRWPDGVVCPHCSHDEVYTIRDGKLFKCKNKEECGKQFTVRIGTVMEDSKVPLRKWLYAMYLFAIHSKGVASTRMAEQVGVTQKTAWFMDHRMREAFADSGIVLDGEVEVDEAYIGGKESNMHADKKLNVGPGAVGKQAVLGLRECGGATVTFPISDTTGAMIAGAIEAHRHTATNHGAGIYSRGLTRGS